MIFISILVLWVISLCLHEYAHARVAYAGGDISVKAKGYLSMNPLKYLHPVMSIVIPLVILAVGGVPLPGGAVYIDRRRLRNRNWEAAVSAAGPAANLVVFLLCAAPFAFGFYDPAQNTGTLWQVLALFAFFQALAVVLNLMPVPGLDGFGIVAPYLPYTWRRRANELSNALMVGFLIVMITPNPVSIGIGRAALGMVSVVGVPEDLFWRTYREFRQFSLF